MRINRLTQTLEKHAEIENAVSNAQTAINDGADVSDALAEIGEMLSEQEDAICELAEMIAGKEE